MTETREHKPFRIDSFSDKKHNSFYFDDIVEAIKKGVQLNNNGKVVFLLEHVIDGKYDVVREIK